MIKLEDIPSNTSIFIDTNIFTYFLLYDISYYDTCKSFLKRIDLGEIVGFIDNIVITETLFNFIKSRIIKKHRIKLNEFSIFIKNNSREISSIDISKIVDIFSISNLYLINLPLEYFIRNLKIIYNKNLLSNDLYHLLVMEYASITNIATNDVDFDSIKEITAWKP